jgi:hypothetical protein
MHLTQPLATLTPDPVSALPRGLNQTLDTGLQCTGQNPTGLGCDLGPLQRTRSRQRATQLTQTTSSF